MKGSLIFQKNMPGPFYTDSECIACDTCTSIAPNHFRLTSNYEHAYVHHQPKTESEYKKCEEALTTCPVGAIFGPKPKSGALSK